ncbi:hypothetical protein GCM10010294_38730 [Streptomyces griseoloalbus]|nr:hypothetical protein GCM10010294_38730 [Streptomyces griseoloalbus]
MTGDDADVVGPPAAAGQRPFGAGEFRHREVEQRDAHPGFADVDADQPSAVRRDADQGAGPAAVRAEAARLLHQPLGEQFGDDVADGARTQSRGRTQCEPAHRAVEIQPLQNGGAVLSPQVTDGASDPLGHPAPPPWPTAGDRPCATS